MTRSKPIAFLASAALIPLSALAVAACGGGAAATASPPLAPPKNTTTPTRRWTRSCAPMRVVRRAVWR
jgi:hypothetical protein